MKFIILGLLIKFTIDVNAQTYKPTCSTVSRLLNQLELHERLEKHLEDYKACFGGRSPLTDLDYNQYCNPRPDCPDPQNVLIKVGNYIKSNNLKIATKIDSKLDSLVSHNLLEQNNLKVMCNEYMDYQSESYIGYDFYKRAKTVIMNSEPDLQSLKGNIKAESESLIFTSDETGYETELMDLCDCGTLAIYKAFKENPEVVPLPNNLISNLGPARVFEFVNNLCFTDESKKYLKGLSCSEEYSDMAHKESNTISSKSTQTYGSSAEKFDSTKNEYSPY